MLNDVSSFILNKSSFNLVLTNDLNTIGVKWSVSCWSGMNLLKNLFVFFQALSLLFLGLQLPC